MKEECGCNGTCCDLKEKDDITLNISDKSKSFTYINEQDLTKRLDQIETRLKVLEKKIRNFDAEI